MQGRISKSLQLWFVILTLFGGSLSLFSTSHAATLPEGFQESIAISGLNSPMSVRFSSDGRVFIAEKSGIIKVFNSLTDTNPQIFADLRTEVYNFWDRGLNGFALDPGFPAKPYLYVLYAYDAAIGGTAPKWGMPDTDSDPCPTPPGANDDGCVVSGRLSRLTANGNTMTNEQVLIEDWCQQYPSHSLGALVFDAQGALYVSAGEGAGFNSVDYGQKGTPLNPCGDPPGGVGAKLSPPTAEGGALRAQDLRTRSDPVGLSGTLLRIDPATGTGLADNPLASDTDANARRIVAYGMRNPYRFTIRPHTNEIWIGDVGMNTWEEIDRISNPTAGVTNFGWPCYEGGSKQPGYSALNLNLCKGLYATPNAVTPPYYAYKHSGKVVRGETCPTGSSSISGMAFESDSSYPDLYKGALFFADYSRNCIWAMLKGSNGQPDPNQIKTFVAGASGPVELVTGPDGDLFYVDIMGGTVRRIHYAGTGASALPSPWVSQDIGRPGTAGSASYANEVYTVNGAGPDIWGNMDAFQFVYQPLNGDGSIIARVNNVQNTDPWAKAGVMIRDGLQPYARNAFVGLTAGNGLVYQSRLRPLGVTTSIAAGAQMSQNWVRLDRSGNTVTAYTSGDGLGWTPVRSEVIPMAVNADVGLAVTSHQSRTLSTATFDNVRMLTGTPPPVNRPPVPVINTPSAGLTWKVGDQISFSGSATDPEGQAVTLKWEVIIHHCPSNCHTHQYQTYTGSSGAFAAPDHEYPSYLEIKLTATDAQGAQASSSVMVYPQTVSLSLRTNPTGLQLGFNAEQLAAPFSKTVINGSTNSISALTPQSLLGRTYNFSAWSDGGATSHDILANPNLATFTATFTAVNPGP